MLHLKSLFRLGSFLLYIIIEYYLFEYFYSLFSNSVLGPLQFLRITCPLSLYRCDSF